jgi:ABC-2 type transport system permease protein
VNVVRAELLKAVTTRLLLWFGLALLALLVFVLSTRIGSDNLFSLAQHTTQRSILETAGLAAVITVLLGSVLVTTEYAHGTINQTFLAVPVRERVFAAKLVAVVMLAVATAIVSAALTLAITEIWYSGRGVDLHLGGGTMTPFLGAVAASALAGAIGLGFGTLLRRQTAAIVLIMVWLLIGEAAVGAIGDKARYAPGHAIAAVLVAHRKGTHDLLGVWGGVATALVYAALFGGLGLLVAARSDVESRAD